MYKFVIDTDSEKLSSVNVYADTEKTKRIAAPLDAVGRFAQTVKVAFIGARKPSADDALQLVVSWDGLTDSILKASGDTAATRVYIAQAGTPADGEADTWSFPVRFESVALEAALVAKKKITMRGAVVVDNAAAGTHAEYHFSVGASASIFAGAVADPQTAAIEFAQVQRLSWAEYQALETLDDGVIYVVADAPTVVEIHNEDTDAHKALFNAVRAEIPDASVVEETAAAVERIQESFTPLLETVPPNGNDDHGAVFGYVGTLRNLGAFGGSVPVRRLSVWTRSTSATLANSAVSIWARILKAADGAWVVAAQSENSLRFQDIGINAEATWTMKPVPGVTPPSADETVAIVFVNAEDAAAGTSNGGFSLRVQSGVAGGRTGELPADPANVAVETWSPKIKLRFAALAGAKPAATQEALDALAGTVEAQGLSIDQAVEDLTGHDDAIAALQSTIAEQNVKIAVLEAKTGIRKAYAYMTQTHFEATGGEATLYAYNAADSMSNATTEADWITGYTLNEVGDYTNTITVAANESATAREATFEVSLGVETFSFTITQAGA